MTIDQQTGVQKLLDLFVFLSENHDHAAKVWDEFTSQLSMAALAATLSRSTAEGFLLSIAAWASETFPVRSSLWH